MQTDRHMGGQWQRTQETRSQVSILESVAPRVASKPQPRGGAGRRRGSARLARPRVRLGAPLAGLLALVAIGAAGTGRRRGVSARCPAKPGLPGERVRLRRSTPPAPVDEGPRTPGAPGASGSGGRPGPCRGGPLVAPAVGAGRGAADPPVRSRWRAPWRRRTPVVPATPRDRPPSAPDRFPRHAPRSLMPVAPPTAAPTDPSPAPAERGLGGRARAARRRSRAGTPTTTQPSSTTTNYPAQRLDDAQRHDDAAEHHALRLPKPSSTTTTTQPSGTDDAQRGRVAARSRRPTPASNGPGSGNKRSGRRHPARATRARLRRRATSTTPTTTSSNTPNSGEHELRRRPAPPNGSTPSTTTSPTGTSTGTSTTADQHPRRPPPRAAPDRPFRWRLTRHPSPAGRTSTGGTGRRFASIPGALRVDAPRGRRAAPWDRGSGAWRCLGIVLRAAARPAGSGSDEAISIHQAQHVAGAGCSTTSARPTNHPPLYFLILWGDRPPCSGRGTSPSTSRRSSPGRC